MTAVADDENVPPGCVDSLAEIIFRRRSTGSPIGAKVASYPETLQKQVLTERKNEKFVQQMQVLAIRRKQSTVRGFANLLGEDVRSEAVVNHAMINRTPLTPQAFDPVFLWDRRIEVEPPQGAPQDPRTSTMFIPTTGGRISAGSGGTTAPAAFAPSA